MHDDRAIVSEMAFGRYAMVTPHSNPTNDSLFIVISGAGFVQVGDERARVNHGEAVMWPAGEMHGAYTDGTEMRAIVVELIGGGAVSLIEATVAEASTDSTDSRATPARGALADRAPSRTEYDSTEGEPW